MEMFKSAYLNEMFKISKKKKLIVASILAVFAIFLAVVAVACLDNVVGIKTAGESGFSLVVLPFFMYTLIPLFSAFICIDMFSGEFTNETIKLTLTRPASRLKIYIAKVASSATFLALFLLFTMLVSLLVSALFGATFQGVLSSIKAYMLAFFPLFILNLMVILISNFARGSASAFLLSIVIFIALKAIEVFVPAFRFFSFTSYFDWYTLFLGSYCDMGKIFRIILLFVGYGMALFSGGFYLFDKRNI